MKNPYDVVYTVMITEKATELSEKQNRYALKVNPSSNKIEIRQAVEAIFDGVKVSSVNVMNCLGKKKRMRNSKPGKRPDWKKALVTLTEGSIDLL
ncbi:MAG: 50S ribosomal protein L23 [Lentisphaerae bacterium]|jgi:large subunit ribosomal protein L23|nr:50S ribosomal protein L23 [Lentisphaerota bacterium]